MHTSPKVQCSIFSTNGINERNLLIFLLTILLVIEESRDVNTQFWMYAG